MNKYIINTAIGLISFATMIAIIFAVAYVPFVWIFIGVPFIIWAAYMFGLMVRDIWEMSREEKSWN